MSARREENKKMAEKFALNLPVAANLIVETNQLTILVFHVSAILRAAHFYLLHSAARLRTRFVCDVFRLRLHPADCFKVPFPYLRFEAEFQISLEQRGKTIAPWEFGNIFAIVWLLAQSRVLLDHLMAEEFGWSICLQFFSLSFLFIYLFIHLTGGCSLIQERKRYKWNMWSLRSENFTI